MFRKFAVISAMVFYGPMNIEAQEVCPDGEVLRKRLVVETPSRLVDIYAMPDNIDADGNVTIEVFENTELITIPAVYEWVPRPADYIAPETIKWTETKDMSGDRCLGKYERQTYYGNDVILKADGNKTRLNPRFIGPPQYKISCKTVIIEEPFLVQHEIPYEPEEWEKDDHIKVMKSPAKAVVRQIPKIYKTQKAEPVLVGKSRRPATLREEPETCLAPLKKRPDLKMADVSVTSWSLIYLAGHELEKNSEETYRIVSPEFDMSSAVLTVGIHPISLDHVWHGFHSGCNPIYNQAISERWVPTLDRANQRHWKPAESVVKKACTVLAKDRKTNQLVEKIGTGWTSIESIFVNKVGPAKAYHIVDRENGILIWYDKNGEGIARFQRID